MKEFLPVEVLSRIYGKASLSDFAVKEWAALAKALESEEANSSSDWEIAAERHLQKWGDSAAPASKAAKSAERMSKAARDGDSSAISKMLAEGVDPNNRDGEGLVPLMHAAKRSRSWCAELLVNGGAKADASDRNGVCVMAMGAMSGDLQTVRLLIRSGATVNARDSTGITPLMLASLAGAESCVRELLGAGANPDETDNNGGCALANAATKGSEGCVKALLDAGAKPCSKDLGGKYPAQRAAESGHWKIAGELAVKCDLECIRSVVNAARAAGHEADISQCVSSLESDELTSSVKSAPAGKTNSARIIRV